MKRVKRKILFYPYKNYVFLFYLIYLKNKKKNILSFISMKILIKYAGEKWNILYNETDRNR